MAEIINFRMSEGNHELAPKKAHHDDAAYDLRATEETVLKAGSRALVKTGLFLELPHGYEAQVRPRSGLAIKHGVTVLNTPGTIDAGYRGEVGVILYNTDANDFLIERGQRVAQMIVQKLSDVELVEVTELSETGRGEGGFGSTGHH